VRPIAAPTIKNKNKKEKEKRKKKRKERGDRGDLTKAGTNQSETPWYYLPPTLLIFKKSMHAFTHTPPLVGVISCACATQAGSRSCSVRPLVSVVVADSGHCKNHPSAKEKRLMIIDCIRPSLSPVFLSPFHSSSCPSSFFRSHVALVLGGSKTLHTRSTTNSIAHPSSVMEVKHAQTRPVARSGPSKGGSECVPIERT
jgi:hypothetical protein